MIVIFLILFAGILGACKNEMNNLYMDYGTSVNELKLSDLSGKEIKNIFESKKYTFAFYLDDKCGACIEKLELINRMAEIIPSEFGKTLIIWKTNPDLKLIKKKSLTYNNYVLKDVIIKDGAPSGYIIKNNKVVFKMDILDMTKYIEKIFQLDDINLERIQTSSNEFILDNWKDTANKTPLIVYFKMEGCPDCKKAEEIINDANLVEKYQLLEIYYQDIDSGGGEIIDEGDLFKQIYGISWYPSFLIFKNNNWRIVEEIAPEELIDELFHYE